MHECHNGVHPSKHKQLRPVASNHLRAQPHYEEKTYYAATPSREQHLRFCRGKTYIYDMQLIYSTAGARYIQMTQ